MSVRFGGDGERLLSKQVRINIQKALEYLEGGNQVSPKSSPLQRMKAQPLQSLCVGAVMPLTKAKKFITFVCFTLIRMFCALAKLKDPVKNLKDLSPAFCPLSRHCCSSLVAGDSIFFHLCGCSGLI